jgi:hypothetical protein
MNDLFLSISFLTSRKLLDMAKDDTVLMISSRTKSHSKLMFTDKGKNKEEVDFFQLMKQNTELFDRPNCMKGRLQIIEGSYCVFSSIVHLLTAIPVN